MAKIRGSVALALSFIDLIGSIALFSLLIVSLNNNSNEKSPRKLNQINFSHSNLRGTKLKLLKEKSGNKELILKSRKLYNPSYFNEDEFVLQEKMKSEISSPKRIRRLTNRDNSNIVLFLDLGAIFFTFILIFSFCVEKNECCDKDSQQELGMGCCIGCCLCSNDCHCRGGNCDCNCNGSDGQGLLFCLVLLLVFIALYYAVKACGKHISRYFAITANFLIFSVIFTLSFLEYIYEINYLDLLLLLILGISGVLAVSNFLGILLPNLNCCKCLRYGYTNNLEIVEEPILPSVDPVNPDNPIVTVEANQTIPSPVYVPPGSDFANVPTYPPTEPINPPIYPPPGYNNTDEGYNSNQGNIYANLQPDLAPPPQPISEPIYQNDLPSQEEVYSGGVPKPQ